MENVTTRVIVMPLARSWISKGKKTEVAITAKYSPQRLSNHRPTASSTSIGSIPSESPSSIQTVVMPARTSDCR